MVVNYFETFMIKTFCVMTVMLFLYSVIGEYFYKDSCKITRKKLTYEMLIDNLERNRQIFILLMCFIMLGMIYSFSFVICIPMQLEVKLYMPYLLMFIIGGIVSTIMFARIVYYLYKLIEIKNKIWFNTLPKFYI